MNNGSLPGRAIPGVPQPIPGIGPMRVAGKLEKTEWLEMENLALRTQNIALQEKQLQQDLIQANRERQELQAALEKKRQEYGVKYGVDITAPTTKIMNDGTILDQRPAPPPQGIAAAPPPPPVPPAPAPPAAQNDSPQTEPSVEVTVEDPAGN